MRIAHISDLHICAEHFRENIPKTEELLQQARNARADHLVVTGDISHYGHAIDFHIFRELLIKSGWYHRDKVSMVIGNHDIYGGVHLAADLPHFPQRCRNIDYAAKVRRFQHYFRGSFAGVQYLNPGNPFPFIKIIEKTIFIGINSIDTYSLVRNPAASNGRIGLSALKQLHTFLDKYRDPGFRKIILIHHHFTPHIDGRPDNMNRLFRRIEYQTMKMRGARRLLRLLARHDIDLILHGHIHFNMQYRSQGIRIAGGGGSVKDERDGLMRLNIIDVGMQGTSIDIQSLTPPEEVPGIKSMLTKQPSGRQHSPA